MWIYIYNFISIPVYQLLVKKKKMCIVMIGIQLFLILAFRDVTVGYDLGMYSNGYEFIKSLSFGDMISRFRVIDTANLPYPFNFESGYMLFNWLVSKVGVSFHGFLVICAAVTSYSVCNYVYKYSESPWLSFILYIGFGIYSTSFGILRQSLALSLALISIDYIINHRWKIVIPLLIIAFLFHRSALLMIIPCLLSNYVFNKRRITICIVANLAFVFIAPLFFNRIVSPLLVWLGKSRYSTVNFSMNNLIILMFIIAISIVVFVDLKTINQKYEHMALNMFMLSIPLEILGMCNEILARSVHFYFIGILIIIPNIVKAYGTELVNVHNKGNNDNKGKILISIFITLGMLALMIRVIKGTPMVPYIIYNSKTI